MFIKCVGAYVKFTPFDNVKNQLIAKIKEIYIPDQASVAGIANKMSQLDFTGAEEDEAPRKKPAAKGVPNLEEEEEEH